MIVIKNWMTLAIVLIAVIIGVSESIRVRTRYVRVRYTSRYGYYSSSDSGSRLSGGVIAAIVISSIATPVIVTVCIICCVVCCKSRDQRASQAGRVITRSPQVVSTITAAQTPNVHYAQPNGSHFTKFSYPVEPPNSNGLIPNSRK